MSYHDYKNIILNLKRGNYQGTFSNAKPIFVISLLDAIEQGFLSHNEIPFNSKRLIDIYSNNYRKERDKSGLIFRANSKITPYNYPYFHMNAEPFYHIKWKDGIIAPEQSSSPSCKYLKEHIDYAFLDEELWKLLQSSEVRYDLRKELEDKFIKP